MADNQNTNSVTVGTGGGFQFDIKPIGIPRITLADGSQAHPLTPLGGKLANADGTLNVPSKPSIMAPTGLVMPNLSFKPIVGVVKPVHMHGYTPGQSILGLQTTGFTGKLSQDDKDAISKPPVTAGAPRKEQDPQLNRLNNTRLNSTLHEINVKPALALFKNAAKDGGLSQSLFKQSFQALCAQEKKEVPDDEHQEAVFELFDKDHNGVVDMMELVCGEERHKDHNGVVDMMELVCGVSLLCGGSEEEKIHAVFDAFDEDGNGLISMDEMHQFMTSVFKVVLTENVLATMKKTGVEVTSPEDLAYHTTAECFKQADADGDGMLNVAEFKSWFYAPKGDNAYMFAPMANGQMATIAE